MHAALILALALLMGAVGAAGAEPVRAEPLQVLSEGPAANPGARVLVVHSARLGADIRVTVFAPPEGGVRVGGRRPAGLRLAAVYALDGGWGLAGPVAQMLSQVSAIEPAYLVAIDYPEGAPDRRSRDLLFDPVSENGETFGGGGRAFRDFLVLDLRPFLAARFPLDPARAFLLGHSFGGLFAANVMAESPESFAGYVIASASVWRSPGLVERLRAARFAGPVLITAGADEGAAMVEGVGQMAAALGPARVRTHVFEGEGHIGYYPALVPEALKWLLPPASAGRTVVALPPAALARFVGEYAYEDGRRISVELRDGRLFTRITGLPGEAELQALGAARFGLPGFDITFDFEGPGPAAAITISINGAVSRAIRAR